MIKKTIIILLALFPNVLDAQEDYFCSVKNIKVSTFNLIQDLDSNDLSNSINQMMNYKLMKQAILENEQLNSKVDSLSITEIEVKKRRERWLVLIIEKSSAYDIEWSEVEYRDFTYSVTYDEGFRTLNADLYFSFNKNLFKVNVEAIYIDGAYHIVQLKRFSKTDSIR
jgi:hypothetical protein